MMAWNVLGLLLTTFVLGLMWLSKVEVAWWWALVPTGCVVVALILVVLLTMVTKED
jgi:hypothetical protein